MKTFFYLFTSLLLFSAGAARAQTLVPGNPAPTATADRNSANEEDSNRSLWQARFQNGGHYMVRLDKIASASRHEYIGNGAARVVEVTIATDSAVVARMYWLTPVVKDTPIAAGQIIVDRAEQLVKQVAGKVSPSIGKLQVVKDYPNTTHAHTVEYALQDITILESLYDSLLRSVNTGRGRTWKEPAPE